MKSNPLSRRLLTLLAYLPGGLGEENVRSILGERGVLTKAKSNEAVVCLHQLRLVERRPDRRLRMLNPLRECVKRDLRIIEIDRKRLINHYLDIAEKGSEIGGKGWAEVRDDVESEADNLDPVCDLAFNASGNHPRLRRALSGLSAFHRSSGRGAVQSLVSARTKLRHKPPSLMGARCSLELGRIALVRSDHRNARALLEEALTLYRQIDDLRGQAAALQSLGEDAFLKFDLGNAGEHFQNALSLFRRIHEPHGEVASTLGLGSIALQRSDHETARTRMEQARAINADAGSLLNEVNCVIGLAEIPIRRFEHQTAIISLQEALALCRRIGSVLNQANCTMKLGQIELHRSNGETAAFYFEDALVLYRRIGDLLGEGNCAGGLGRIARLTSNHTRACALFEGALTLFRTGGYEMQESLARIELGRAQRDAGDVMLCLGNIEAGFAQYFGKADLADRALSGWHCVRSGLTCEDPDEAANSREKARSAWAAIGRFDLIHNWIGER